MNRYYFDGLQLIFDGCSGNPTFEQKMQDSVIHMEKLFREYRKANSIHLFPHKRAFDDRIVFMTLEEGCRDTRFCRVPYDE